MRRPLLLALLAAPAVPAALAQPVTLLGRYATNTFDAGGAEIAAYDPATRWAFLISAAAARVVVVSLANPAAPTLVTTIDVSAYGAGVNSVAVRDGLVAVAVEAAPKTAPGRVVVFARDGTFLAQAAVGALPDALTFTPDGRRIVVACEGEPNSYGQPDSVDPDGSVAVVDVARATDGTVTLTPRLATFTAFNGQEAALRAQGVRIYGPGASAAQDFEPEYAAVAPDGATAYVTLQENNALAVVDLATATVTGVVPLGYKDHNVAGAGLDASDQNGGVVNITTWPVFGMYQPDGIAAYEAGGQTYLVLANEGDAREYPGLNELARVSSAAVVLDATAFPNAATLKAASNLGRLNVTTALGDADGDGDFDALYALGARSFSIRRTDGSLVWDSGDAFEQRLNALLPAVFNANHTNNTKKNRSDDKGPEPEGVAVATVNGRTFAFVGLERIGGVMVYDVTDPAAPTYVTYATSRDFTQTPALGQGGDLGPEGLLVVPAADSPTGAPLLLVANEVSGTLAVYGLSAPLPVELVAFTATADGPVARLAWTTASETANAGFHVERRDGDGWTAVGFVPGAGTTGERQQYAFAVPGLAPGRHAFRLRQTDLDGTAHLSATVEVSVAPAAFGVRGPWPNPATDAAALAVGLPAAGPVSAALYDALGRRLATLFEGEAAGVLPLRVETAALPAGVYVVRVVAGGRVATVPVAVGGR